MFIQVHRGLVETVKLPLESGVYNRKLQGEHTLVFSLQSPIVLDLRIGDTLTYKGEILTLNKDPKKAKISSSLYSYDITFEGQRHSLNRFLLKHLGAIKFDYFGDLEGYLSMYLDCINSVDSGWILGDIEATEPVSISFDKSYCLDALNTIAQAFNCEWQIIGKEIIVKESIGTATSINLAYGKDNGLYSLTRESINNLNIVNRVYGIGGSENLPGGYPYESLQLAHQLQDAASIALYGVREGFYSNDSIFPNRTSSATSVNKIDGKRWELIDSTLDFDLEGQRIQGTDAKIVFKSGALNGQSFKIISYNHSTKTIRYEANTDSNGGVMPSGMLVAEIGDEYTLIGIRMPSTYVDAAITELEEKTGEFLNTNKIPRVAYSLDIDVLDSKRKAVYPNEGDIIHIEDEDLGIDDNIRVTGISFPALFPDVLVKGMKFTCEVSNDVTYTFFQKIENTIKESKQILTQTTNDTWENNRRNLLALEEFKNLVIDPDNKLQEALIQAIVGYFGTSSMYFDLDPAPAITMGSESFSIGSTELIHRKYEITGIGYIWEIPSFSETDLNPEKAYYLSARCSKTSLSGVWVLSETIQETESETGYWHFNLGVLSSVIDGSRSFRATRGFTLISGGQIETDVITAYMINVVKLFAQEITATNLTVKGNSMVGPFSIDEDGLFYSVPVGQDWKSLKLNKDGLTWESFDQGPPLPVGVLIQLLIGQGNQMLDLQGHADWPSLTNGIRVDMKNDARAALEIGQGSIKVNGFEGLTIKQSFNDGSGTKYLNINKGIITSITNS